MKMGMRILKFIIENIVHNIISVYNGLTKSK